LKQFGSFTLDTLNECLWRAGVRIALPPKPFAVLRYLVENPGRLITHDELLDALWPETYVQPQVLRTYVLDLRRVLDDDARNPRFIQSLPKRGYSFVATVMDSAAPIAPAQTSPQPAAESLAAVVSRDRELACLQAALKRSAGGARQVVFVTGETGIGKTALIDAFRHQLESTESAMVAHGQCIPGFAGKQDYYPIADALRQVSDSPQADAVSRMLRSNAGVRAAGELAAERPGAPIPGELCAALEEMARDNPFLLILEDLQWADDSTLGVISALARRRGHAKLTIVATIAPQTGSTTDAISRLMHDLKMRRLCIEMPLPRLTKAAVAELLRAHLQQQELPDGLHEFVHQQSEGNPRFVLAIVDYMISQQLLARATDNKGERWELQGPLDQSDAATPGELARMVELEIEHLSAHQQELLEAGSLATIAFPAWLVAAALGQDLASTEEACEELARRLTFVKRAGEDELPDGTCSSFYVFAHALYREVLYHRQSPSRRAVRHIRIAERLRELFRGREELIAREAAAHYEAAGDWGNAIAMLRNAARRALELHAYGEAADLHQSIARLSANGGVGDTHALEIDAWEEPVWSSEMDRPHTSQSRAKA
jgi:predicted ATPase